ncbi:MAG: hypothetical protein WDA16_10275 [Candidatus Thermoplasmatota archaeon]
MSLKTKVFRVTMSSNDIQGFLAECGEANWYAFDTGERIMTDDGPDAEAVLLVEPTPRLTSEKRAPMIQ